MFFCDWSKKEKTVGVVALAVALAVMGLVDMHQWKLDSNREATSRQQFQTCFGSYPGQQTPQQVVTQKLQEKKVMLERADSEANSFYIKLELPMVGGPEHKQIEATRHEAFIEYHCAWQSAKKYGYVVPQAMPDFRD